MFNGKKMLSIILIFLMVIFTYIPTQYADDEDYEDLEENLQVIETSVNEDDRLVLNSKSAIIYDRDSKRVLFGKNENVKRAMASTTKIMTAIIVLENTDLNNLVIISKKAANTGGSRLKINTGDKITVNDLLYGLMLRSGNDAAVALAEYVGGSVDEFAKMMNDKAKKIGLINTNFVTPHGLDDESHYTTAYELAKLTDYALDNDIFAKIVNTKSYTIYINGKTRTINNTNELLGNLEGVNGVKTGFTGNAMRCLVTSCTRNGNQIITVVLGADTKKQRARDSIKLIEYAFSEFERVNIKELVEEKFEEWKNINKNRFNIYKSINNQIDLKLENDKSSSNKAIPIKKRDKDNIKININCIYEFRAPLKEKTIIGNIVVKYNEEIIDIINIINNKEIRKKNTLDYMLEFLSNFHTCLDFYA